MTNATRRRHTLAHIVAAAVAFALLPTAADALMLHNASSATMKLSLYDQNDSSVAVPCFSTEIPTNSQISYTGYPGTCGLYAVVKLKAVGFRSLVSDGGTCWGEHIAKTGSARVSGTVDSCAIVVTSD